jgi:hypothetical protein
MDSNCHFTLDSLLGMARENDGNEHGSSFLGVQLCFIWNLEQMSRFEYDIDN